MRTGDREQRLALCEILDDEIPSYKLVIESELAINPMKFGAGHHPAQAIYQIASQIRINCSCGGDFVDAFEKEIADGRSFSKKSNTMTEYCARGLFERVKATAHSKLGVELREISEEKIQARLSQSASK